MKYLLYIQMMRYRCFVPVDDDARIIILGQIEQCAEDPNNHTSVRHPNPGEEWKAAMHNFNPYRLLYIQSGNCTNIFDPQNPLEISLIGLESARPDPEGKICLRVVSLQHDFSWSFYISLLKEVGSLKAPTYHIDRILEAATKKIADMIRDICNVLKSGAR